MPLKLQSIKKANDGIKKYKATFTDDERTYSVKFGQLGYSDYTINKDEARKQRYLDRHKSNENWNKPDTPGSLSKHILWGPTTSLQKNIQLFKQKFSL